MNKKCDGSAQHAGTHIIIRLGFPTPEPHAFYYTPLRQRACTTPEDEERRNGGVMHHSDKTRAILEIWTGLIIFLVIIHQELGQSSSSSYLDISHSSSDDEFCLCRDEFCRSDDEF